MHNETLLEAEERVKSVDKSRPIHWFTLPPKMAKQLGISKVGMVELTAEEELMCASRARQDQFRLTLELLKEALRYIDSTNLNTGDGSADNFWASRKASFSKLRSLLTAAYAKIHNPDNDETKAFLVSQETIV